MGVIRTLFFCLDGHNNIVSSDISANNIKLQYILDIVIIWPKIPCPWDYHYIQYVLYFIIQNNRTNCSQHVEIACVAS